MCVAPKAPKVPPAPAPVVPPPAPPAPPAPPKPPAPGETRSREVANTASKRTGREALRIDLAINSQGSGLNIPTG